MPSTFQLITVENLWFSPPNSSSSNNKKLINDSMNLLGERTCFKSESMLVYFDYCFTHKKTTKCRQIYHSCCWSYGYGYQWTSCVWWLRLMLGCLGPGQNYTPWKRMASLPFKHVFCGIQSLFSFWGWEGLFSGAMLCYFQGGCGSW